MEKNNQNTPKASTRKKLLTVKVNTEEFKKIKQMADKHASGNVSIWVRRAAMSEPSPAKEKESTTDGGETEKIIHHRV
jgi:hypothetical protein